MNALFPLAAVAVCAVAEAAETPAQLCAALETALQQEVTLLSGITDAAQAQQAVEPLRRCLAEQSAMKGVGEPALRGYISNNPGAQTRLVELLEQLSCQFARLEQQQCYGCRELADALAPQLTAD